MKKFEDLYNELNKDSELKEAWEKAREEEKKANKIMMIISIIIILAGLLKMLLTGFNYFSILVIIFLVFFINMMILVFSKALGKSYIKYTSLFKKIIIENLIKNFYNNVEYFPNKNMPERIYKEAEDEEYYNRYYSDDYIEAKINNNYDIGLAEIKTAEEETYTDSNGNKKTRTTVKFHGLFAKIVIDKSINCKLKIKQNGQYRFSKNSLEMDSRGI